MSYVKLIAKPNTWFKAGTEVYDYDCWPPTTLFRVSLEQWHTWSLTGFALLRGQRITENPDSEGGGKVGDEYWDGETCAVDEFDAEVVEEIQ